MKIAVFGIGGVGGVVGGALARSQPEETYFLARGRNLEAIQRDGLRVQSALLGDFTVRPELAVEDAAGLGVMDAVIMACKGCDLENACRLIAPAVGPGTLVAPLLNGLLISEAMGPLLPPCILTDGTIRVFSHLEGPGHVAETGGFCSVVLGMRDGSRRSELEELAGTLTRAGIETRVSEDILLDSWIKYVVMESMSVLCCYYDGPVGMAQRDPNGEAVLRAVIGELTSVAEAQGVRLPQDLADKRTEEVMRMPPDSMTSLYRDLSSGKPADRTELHLLVGRMVEMGREAGVATPYHETAYRRFTS